MKLRSIFLVMLFASVLFALTAAWGQEKNLELNKDVTAKFRAFDKGLFKGFDVYSAGVKEFPTALLFDRKDSYSIPGRFWGKPLTEEEIVYAIKRLDEQYKDQRWNTPFHPRALNVVNLKGAVVGYVYTGIRTLLIDRKEDGRVIVFLPGKQQIGANAQCPCDPLMPNTDN
ncbi:MAG: hypothetical protein A2Z08_10590 [Deltaproteobacteria bacterium RBG_16_54_11]|nr:MAG: hypothetical protein A2Z08_10590 [Deltaproteobacteria bacterium RBG_16_54_11]